MSFHYFRRSFWPGRNLLNRIWSYHDRNPFPPTINLAIRSIIYVIRKVAFQIKRKQKRFTYGKDGSLKISPRLHIIKQESMHYLKPKVVLQRFEKIHLINEDLHCHDGAWIPQPFSEFYGKGIPIEELALRIRGYLSAYTAVNNPVFLQRAQDAGNYLIQKRIYKDGHIYLQGHITLDIPYAFAGEALLCLYKINSSNKELLHIAKKIGDQLIEYQVAGSVNHAVIPVQFLGQLYQISGEKKYLKNSVKRLFRSAIAYQLPYGGWLGHESWIWYHALILRSLIIGYISLPNTLKYYSKKDKIACSIIAAINRFILAQNADGSLPIRPAEPLCEHKDDNRFISEKAIVSANGTFQKIEDSSITYGSWNGYVIDSLVTAYELLDTKEIIPLLNNFSKNIASSNYVWRLEFDTLGAGRLLEYTHKLAVDKKDHMVFMPHP